MIQHGRVLIAVVPTYVFIPSNTQPESVTSVRTWNIHGRVLVLNYTRATHSSSKKCHFTIIIGVSPHTSILNIISIGPVIIVKTLFLAIAHQAVELFQVVDLYKPSSIQLTLASGVSPCVSEVRKQVLMPFLQMDLVLDFRFM